MGVYSNILLSRILAFSHSSSATWSLQHRDIVQDLKDVTEKVMANKSPYQQADGTFLAKD
jgi:hypothetical protein